MSITDELRKYANRFKNSHDAWSGIGDELTAIADRIDAEHQKAVASVMNDALYHANEKDMAEHGWVRLPVDGEAPCKQLGEWIEKCGLITGPLDHDGELWHKGDMSASTWGVIEGIVFENGKWFIRGHDTSAPWLPADSLLHYHAPTVEDVLREFAYGLGVPVADSYVAAAAAKLRLKEDA